MNGMRDRWSALPKEGHLSRPNQFSRTEINDTATCSALRFAAGPLDRPVSSQRGYFLEKPEDTLRALVIGPPFRIEDPKLQSNKYGQRMGLLIYRTVGRTASEQTSQTELARSI